MTHPVVVPPQVDDQYLLLGKWEAYFAVIGAMGVVLAWTTNVADRTDRVVATGLVFALASWWIFYGRRSYARFEQNTAHGLIYLVGALAMLIPLVDLAPACSWVLFSLSPQIFMLISANWVSGIVVAVFNLLPAVTVLTTEGVGSDFWQEVAIGSGVAGVSMLINSVTERISRQSEERAKLIAQLEASRAEVAQLSRQAGVTAERERLAEEIHDTLAQGFTSILTLVQAATSELERNPDRSRTHLDLAARTARENLGEARALVGALSPAAMGSGSLVDAVRRQAARLTEECGIDTEFDTDGELGGLPTAVEVVLLRAAQEALTNVRRHSGAGSARITLGGGPDRVWLTVADDGSGFDAATPTEGFGLRGMRSRVEQVGGTLTVVSGPSGTTVKVEVCR